MPGFNQLEEFEKDLFSLGKEAVIRRDRGERAITSQLPTSTYIEDDSDDFDEYSQYTHYLAGMRHVQEYTKDIDWK